MKTPHNAEVLDQVALYRGFFSMTKFRLRHETFAGGWTESFEREIFERGHAAAVLPYDPIRDRVVLIEQFRPGALVAGWQRPWLLEVVAGIIDKGRDAATVARAECVEEAGLTITHLVPVSRFLATPGGCSETIALYVGAVDSTDAGGIHGLDHEHEDIRVVPLPADEAIAMVDDGRIDNATAMIALLYLARHRARLRTLFSQDPTPDA